LTKLPSRAKTRADCKCIPIIQNLGGKDRRNMSSRPA
jgi:hypothetical protein